MSGMIRCRTARTSVPVVRSSGSSGPARTACARYGCGRSSKKEVDKGVIEQPVDLVVEAINPRPAGRKVIALTFDDGPSQYTGADSRRAEG